MRAIVLHDDLGADARADELDVFAQAAVFEAVLPALGYAVSRMSFSLDLARTRAIWASDRPDLVVNLVEAVGGEGRLLHLAPALLEALGIPYTGSSSSALLLTTDKLCTKRLLALGGLPTPEWLDRRGHAPPHDLPPGRYIIKPATEDASVGLDDDAVVEASNRTELLAALRSRAEKIGREVFAERYIEGREFNLSVLAGPAGPEVLPIAEIQFLQYPPGRPKLVDYRAKWDANSFEYHHTPRSFEFPAEDAPLLAELARLARECWQLFELRGYARVDFRVDRAGRPWILEINANPCVAPDAGFPAAAQRGGLSTADVVRRIVQDALAAGDRGNLS